MDGRQRTSGRRRSEEIIRQANKIKPRTAGLFVHSVIEGFVFLSVIAGLDPAIQSQELLLLFSVFI
jgi:hypothetical protein